MDAIVIRGRVVAHQVHRVPVFATFLRIEIEPSQSADRIHIQRQLIPSDAAKTPEHTAAPVPRLPLWLSSAV